MDYKILFEQIGSILGSLQRISAGETFKMSRVDVNQIRDLYKLITNGRRINMACASCVEQAGLFIYNWYQENYPLYNVAQKNGATNLKTKKSK